MKRLFLTLLCVFLALPLLSVFPQFYGARSLALGYSTTASNYDVNSLFINPALLSSIQHSLSGYQFQYGYSDNMNFLNELKDVLSYDLENFENLGNTQKGEIFNRLNELFSSQKGIYGFKANIPGYVANNYGFSVSVIQSAFVHPQESDIFNRNVSELLNKDIASLSMNMTGLRYTKYSFVYSFRLSNTINIGIGLHYLNGKISKQDTSIMDQIFSLDSENRDYLKYTWEKADSKFSKIVTDIGATMGIGKFFRIGLVAKNVGDPLITGGDVKIVLKTRYVAGLAFQPDPQFAIYLDVDLDKVDMLYNGKYMQPISLGIEKGFFKNQFMVRAGILNDLTGKYFFGSKSNILYGLGFGFNMGKFILDAAIGINHLGVIDNLAISGFFIIK